MIKTVIRLSNDTVMVFDAKGEQIADYQGQYEEVKERILKAAPPGAVFNHWFGHTLEPMTTPRQNW